MSNNSKCKSLLFKAFYLLGMSRYMQSRKFVLLFKELLKREIWLKNKDRNYIYCEFMKCYREGSRSEFCSEQFIKKWIKIFNGLERKYDGYEKKNSLKRMILGCRDQSIPVVFYLASYNRSSSDSHAKFQGKIYVDSEWKSCMSSHHELEWLIYPIESYIRDHNIKSIQWVSGLNGDKESPYLMLRPYCHHFFIPISTWDVLTSSLNAIKRDTPQAHMHRVRQNRKLANKNIINELKRVVNT